MMQLLNFPVDIWFDIMKHLSLSDLAALHTAFTSSETPIDVSIINRFAVNVITQILAFDECKASGVVFTDNAPCYTYRLLHEWKCLLHGDDHEDMCTKRPCGDSYEAGFHYSMEFSRTFCSQPEDLMTTEMTIFANDGKPFDERSREPAPVFPELGNTGPTQLVWATVEFGVSADSCANRDRVLHFMWNTIGTNIEETFSDVVHSPMCVIRTVAHQVPLEKVTWIELDKETQMEKITELPKEWYEFWLTSGIRVISTFSKELKTVNDYLSGEVVVVQQWRWKMTSFRTEWKLPIPMSSGLLLSRSVH